jgi:hypothetical protein
LAQIHHRAGKEESQSQKTPGGIIPLHNVFPVASWNAEKRADAASCYNSRP